MTELLYKPDKTPEDINTLIGRHKNLIYYVLGGVGQLYNQDCESAAWGALWDAVCTFDVYGPSAFSTYAVTLIRNAINSELRKEATRHRHETTLDEYSGISEPIVTEELNRIEAIFAEFIAKCAGQKKNVMLVWQASGYEAKGTTIATICKCTPSYVSRVQQDFRAFVSVRMKEL